MVDLSVDKLWNSFHNSSLIASDYTEYFDSEGVIVIDIASSGLFALIQ